MNFKETYTVDRASLNKTGVYSIEHINYPGYYYIGSASKYDKIKYRDVGFLQRWRNHFATLKRGVHHNRYLQRVISKYGIEGIRFNIIEFCEPFICGKRETFYIQQYNKNYKTFNFSDYSCPMLGVKHSKQAIEKRIASRRVQVFQYDLDGNFIRKYISLSEAARQVNLKTSCIGAACKRNGSAGYYQWSYKKEEKKKHKRYFHNTDKIVYQFDYNGNFISRYNSMKEASDKTKVRVAYIRRSASHGSIIGGKFIWSFRQTEERRWYSKKRIPVVQYDHNMNFIKEFNSVSDASVELKTGTTNITNCCKGKCNTVKGFIFKYK